MVKDHGPILRSGVRYEVLRKKGMSKERAARIANSLVAERHGDRVDTKKGAVNEPNQRF